MRDELRQKAVGSKQKAAQASVSFLPSAFCLLLSTFCSLSFSSLIPSFLPV